MWIQDSIEYRVWIQPTRYRSVDTGHHRIQKLQQDSIEYTVWIQDTIEYRSVDTGHHRIQKLQLDYKSNIALMLAQ